VLGHAEPAHERTDEALSLPTAESALTALRTQQIIAEESGVADTVDPLAGSYYVESLTTELENAALKLMAEVEARGGMLKAIETGFVQEEIHRAAYRTQRAVDGGRPGHRGRQPLRAGGTDGHRVPPGPRA
jgi:methylmalonyl-CoA mutase N-terminal domain/subunit